MTIKLKAAHGIECKIWMDNFEDGNTRFVATAFENIDGEWVYRLQQIDPYGSIQSTSGKASSLEAAEAELQTLINEL